jgi:hypothetical protein
MSNLLMGLGLLGVAALLGVLLINYFQQRKVQRELQCQSVMARQDPGAGAEGLALEDASYLEPSGGLRGNLPFELLDVLIDSIISLDLHTPLYGQKLLQHMPDTRRVGGKALLFEAKNLESDSWEYPRADQQYRHMQLGVQLLQGAHRLNNIDFSEFVAAAHAYAEKVHATVELPDMREELARAKELEALAKEVGVEVELCVSARETPWSAGYVQQHAQRLGFVPGMYPGRMVYSQAWHEGAAAQPIFTLHFDAQAALAEDLGESALRLIRLVLDVPQVPRQLAPYATLRQVAVDFAAKMGGYISDESGRNISADFMDSIALSLEAVYDQLDARDLAAGSPLARRLFAI